MKKKNVKTLLAWVLLIVVVAVGYLLINHYSPKSLGLIDNSSLLGQVPVVDTSNLVQENPHGLQAVLVEQGRGYKVTNIYNEKDPSSLNSKIVTTDYSQSIKHESTGGFRWVVNYIYNVTKNTTYSNRFNERYGVSSNKVVCYTEKNSPTKATYSSKNIGAKPGDPTTFKGQAADESCRAIFPEFQMDGRDFNGTAKDDVGNTRGTTIHAYKNYGLTLIPPKELRSRPDYSEKYLVTIKVSGEEIVQDKTDRDSVVLTSNRALKCSEMNLSGQVATADKSGNCIVGIIIGPGVIDFGGSGASAALGVFSTVKAYNIDAEVQGIRFAPSSTPSSNPGAPFFR